MKAWGKVKEDSQIMWGTRQICLVFFAEENNCGYIVVFGAFFSRDIFGSTILDIWW